MDNQERNREALVDHIAEQDRILRRRNEQIARQAKQIENQAQNAEEAQRAIDEQAALIDTLRAENPRPLTADDITDEMAERAWDAFWNAPGKIADLSAMSGALRAALTPSPSRPEGAEELQALIRQAEAEGEGADNEALANYLAARLIDPTVKEQS